MKSFLLVLICTAMIVGSSDGQTQQSQTGQDAMEHRGNQGMGFDQQKTTHHFLLRKDGGAIQVTRSQLRTKKAWTRFGCTCSTYAGRFSPESSTSRCLSMIRRRPEFRS